MIPKWHEFMAPVLTIMADGLTRDRSQITELAADVARITPDERKVTLTTGQPKYANRVGWAISHLTKAGALDRPQRGNYVISAAGLSLLKSRPLVSLSDVEAVTGYRRSRSGLVVSGNDEPEADVAALDP